MKALSLPLFLRPAANGAIIVYASLSRKTTGGLSRSATHDATTLLQFHQSAGSKPRPPKSRFVTPHLPPIRFVLDSYPTPTSQKPR